MWALCGPLSFEAICLRPRRECGQFRRVCTPALRPDETDHSPPSDIPLPLNYRPSLLPRFDIVGQAPDESQQGRVEPKVLVGTNMGCKEAFSALRDQRLPAHNRAQTLSSTVYNKWARSPIRQVHSPLPKHMHYSSFEHSFHFRSTVNASDQVRLLLMLLEAVGLTVLKGKNNLTVSFTS